MTNPLKDGHWQRWLVGGLIGGAVGGIGLALGLGAQRAMYEVRLARAETDCRACLREQGQIKRRLAEHVCGGDERCLTAINAIGEQ